MVLCKKCGNPRPNRYIDENGKVHNCQRRKYCFKCSPYGSRNTSKLENVDKDANGMRICKTCGKSFDSRRRLKCFSCNVNKQRKIKKEYLTSIMGHKCWRCGYGGSEKYNSLLEMHHVNPDEKMFDLTISTIGKKSKEEILEESKKCVLLCPNCHREYHNSDIISDNEMKELHKKWNDIKL